MAASDYSVTEISVKGAIVVPTNRRDGILSFLDGWKDEFTGQRVIVVEDNPERKFDLDRGGVEHYSWKEIDEELGDDSWIIPRRTDCIRSFGFLKAWEKKVDFIVSLDDDCLPAEDGYLAKHWQMLTSPAPSPAWISTVEGAKPRGVPYLTTNRTLGCVLNHGLWTGVPDLDGVTQLQGTRHPAEVKLIDRIVPRGMYFPTCGMNLAFKAELAPIMYFLLMGQDWPYDRFGDIWCGIFAKRICDQLGYAARSGHPYVGHQRASDVWTNLRKEAPAYEVNEKLWQVVDSAQLTGKTFAECYHELADQLTLPGEYWPRLRAAMHVWANLFAPAANARTSSLVAAEETTRP